MHMTFIGCGDSFADKLGNNSAFLEWDGHRLLIDLPDSNYTRIKEVGLDYSDIDHIFITHLHADHINGLERFAYYRQFATPVVRPEKKGTKVTFNEFEDTIVLGTGSDAKTFTAEATDAAHSFISWSVDPAGHPSSYLFHQFCFSFAASLYGLSF